MHSRATHGNRARDVHKGWGESTGGVSGVVPQGRPPPAPQWSTVAVIALAVAILVAGVLVFIVVTQPLCAGCPGQTPLGASLAVGSGTGACPAGNGTSPVDCAYTFPIREPMVGSSPPAMPSAGDVSFELLNASNDPINASFFVALITPGGSWITTWSSSTQVWSTPTNSAPCPGSACLSAPLAAGDSFLLRSLPGGGLPFSGRGDQLQVKAIGGGFSGWVDAPIY